MIKGGAFDIGLNVVFNQGNGVLKMKKHEDECKNDAINVTKLMLQKQWKFRKIWCYECGKKDFETLNWMIMHEK